MRAAYKGSECVQCTVFRGCAQQNKHAFDNGSNYSTPFSFSMLECLHPLAILAQGTGCANSVSADITKATLRKLRAVDGAVAAAEKATAEKAARAKSAVAPPVITAQDALKTAMRSREKALRDSDGSDDSDDSDGDTEW